MSYALVPEVKRGKLDQKAEVIIFLGNNSISKGYTIYNPLTEKFLIGRNVKFDEFSKWNLEKC